MKIDTTLMQLQSAVGELGLARKAGKRRKKQLDVVFFKEGIAPTLNFATE